MATSAKCTYSAVQMAGTFNYEVIVQNSSPYPYDIYYIDFGFHEGVPLPPSQLQNIALISSPPCWSGSLYGPGINWYTNYQGGSITSCYILPGQTGKFVFQSSTPPPENLPFSCGFYNNDNAWGFGFNGTAYLAGRESVPVPPAIYNPWWWIETRGGLVPPGPPPPWLQEFLGALALAGNAGVSPQMRASLLERALGQIPIASAAIKKEIEALQKK